MTKYEIYTDDFEFRFGTHRESIPAASAEDIWAWYLAESANDPHLCASFDSLEEAQEEFRKNYAEHVHTYDEKSYVFWLLRGDVAWIDENEYDEDGEIDQTVCTWDVAAEPYNRDEVTPDA